MNPLFGSLAAWPAQQLLNHLLGADPHLARQLGRFQGKSLQLRVKNPNLAMTVLIDADRVQLSPLDSEALLLEADATLEGTAADLLGILLRSNQDRPLADPAIKISGDGSLVQDLYSTLQSLDIDWEDRLAPVLGDVASNGIARVVEDARHWSQSARASLRRNVDDYIKEEARLVPARTETDRFSADLDRLKLQIDRVTARAELMLRRLEELSN